MDVRIFLICASCLVSVCLSDCNLPLGMESGQIADDRISASSSFEPRSVGPQNSRLNTNHGGGAWCPQQFVSKDLSEFLEIDLGVVHTVTGVLTQGRFANGLGQEFAELYLVQYWRPGMDDFATYETNSTNNVMKGNWDTSTRSSAVLDPPVLATRVRIIPYSEHLRMVCMRVELLGCTPPQPTQRLLDHKLLAILTGVLLTVSLLLLVVVLVLLRGRGLKRYPSVSSISVSASTLQRKEEPVYQEPSTNYSTNCPKKYSTDYSINHCADYSTPISVIYSRPLSVYATYTSPDNIMESLTDISYLEESSVDSSSSSGTPRLPPIPDFVDSGSYTHIYSNQDFV